MPLSFVFVGILTGTFAAVLSLSVDSGALVALLTYSVSGALALFGAGLITAIRRNHWPFNRKNRWHQRLQQMAREPKTRTRAGVFSGLSSDPQIHT